MSKRQEEAVILGELIEDIHATALRSGLERGANGPLVIAALLTVATTFAFTEGNDRAKTRANIIGVVDTVLDRLATVVTPETRQAARKAVSILRQRGGEVTAEDIERVTREVLKQ
jgi:hypothetical protein